MMITPHTSGISDRIWQRQTELLIDNLGRWFGASRCGIGLT